MRTKSKSTIIIAITFTIGFVLGIIVSGVFVKEKIKNYREMGTKHGFKYHFYKHINPTETQKKQVDQILDKYSQIFKNKHDNFITETRAIKDSFINEMKPVLNDEQNTELVKFVERHKHKKRRKCKPDKSECKEN